MCPEVRGETNQNVQAAVRLHRGAREIRLNLLQNILNQAPGFYIAGENCDALLGLYESCRSVTYSKHTWGHQPTQSSSPWFGAERLDPASYAKQLAKVFVSEVVRPPKDARVIGFKEVRFADKPGLLLNYLEFIKYCFSPAKFILTSREPKVLPTRGSGDDTKGSSGRENQIVRGIGQSVSRRKPRHLISGAIRRVHR